VREVTVLQVAPREHERAAVVGGGVQLLACRVNVGDGGAGAGAVDHAEPTVVSQAHDPIAGLKGGAVGRPEAGAGELAGGLQAGAGALVELVDVGASQGDHDRLGTAGLLVGAPPVGDKLLTQRLCVLPGDDAALLLVGGDGPGGVAVTPLVERLLFPGVGLPAVSVSSIAGNRVASVRKRPPASISGS
jgi:hypothetical protein